VKVQIIFEDKALLLVNKPSGLIVNRSQTVKQPTIQDWLEENFKFKIFDWPKYRSGLVHRLDKETSGLLLIAKTPQMFEKLQDQFKQRQVKKHYLALVHGRVFPEKGVIRAALSRNPFNREKFGVFLGGREAKTSYKIIRYYCNKQLGDYNLLEISPETGRTHQIRVHLKYWGYPVVGDSKYAGRKTARADRRWCPRQFLHASFLAFQHPQTGRQLDCFCPLPAILKRALETLQPSP